MQYPFYVGNLKQQRITEPESIIYAWCLVSPKMSLFPSDEDVYKILPVEASLVENSLDGKKLRKPQSLAIRYINPFNGMDKYEVIPYYSQRFNIQSIPDNSIIYEELQGKFGIQRPTPYISANTLAVVFALFATLSLAENRNN